MDGVGVGDGHSTEGVAGWVGVFLVHGFDATVAKGGGEVDVA